MINTLSEIKSFRPELRAKFSNSIIDNLHHVTDDKKFGHCVLPYASAKTMIGTVDIPSHLIETKGLKVIIWSATYVSLLSEYKLKFEVDALYKEISPRRLRESYQLTSLDELKTKFESISGNDSILLITTSNQWLATNIDDIVSLIKKYDLVDKVLWNNDEAGREVSSSADTTPWHGSKVDPAKYKARKYKTYKKFKEVGFQIGYTGDFKREIVDPCLGTEDYVILNQFAERGENWESLSAAKEPKFYDPTLPISEMFPEFANYVIGQQCKLQKLDDITNNKYSEKHKLIGLFQLPTASSSRHTLDEFAEEMKIMAPQPNFIGKDIIITTSEEIRAWTITKEGVIELSESEKISKDYTSDDNLQRCALDAVSPLTFYGVIDKFIYGGNLKTICSLISFRSYGTKNPNKTPITDNEGQFAGRGTRLVESKEDILETVSNDKKLFCDYDYILNTHQSFYPDTTNWRHMVDRMNSIYLDANEVQDKQLSLI